MGPHDDRADTQGFDLYRSVVRPGPVSMAACPERNRDEWAAERCAESCSGPAVLDVSWPLLPRSFACTRVRLGKRFFLPASDRHAVDGSIDAVWSVSEPEQEGWS